MEPQIDPLSPLARQLLKLDTDRAYETLVPKTGGNADAKALLDAASADDMLAVTAANLDDATLLRSGLYLWHDWLHASHEISQSIATGTASFWHAVMHRREGDFANSKYWYARCADHPILPVLAAQANPVINPMPVDKSILRLTVDGWNPNAFVDLVQAVHNQPTDPRHRLAVALQQLEWRMLFDHTVRSASGGKGAQYFTPGKS
jgi:hypothetical protein